MTQKATSKDYALGYAEGFNDACKKPTWVGLTPDERTVIIDQWRWDEGKADYLCRLVEAKLKEKNNV